MSSTRRSRGEETTSLRATTHQSHASSPHAPLALHVVYDGRAETFPLESGKTLVIGRSAGASIRIDEPSVSRRHLAIEVSPGPSGPQVTAHDLGSTNGVKLGDEMLTAGQRLPVQPGVVIEIGSALIVLQRAAAASAPRRVWSHGYFEGRLQDECSRVERIGGAFCVLRLRVAKEDEARALDLLSAELDQADVVALYGPGEIEALLLDARAGDAGAVAGRIVELLADERIASRAGAAKYPVDGRAADALMAIAGERLGPIKGRARGKSERAIYYGKHLADLERVLERIARGDINVLVSGETGTGKELVAEMVHRLSPRAGRPFVRLNCGGFTETLLASELFGHERGAFTGADRAKVGLLESADGGTVFLDEVGELPLNLQPKLLRALEAGEVQRVGALRPKSIDVRFISATNRNLEAESQAGRFRADLYYRLAGFSVMLLPLRERRAEIPALTQGLLADAALAAGVPVPAVEPEAMALLEQYSWPGNARELRNVLQRALLLAEHGRIGIQHLPADKLTMRIAAPSHVEMDAGSLQAALSAHERQRILDELARCGGNQTHAARALGISRGTLLARMDAFGITRPRKRPEG